VPVERSPTSAAASDDVGGYNAAKAFRRGKRQRLASPTSSEDTLPTYQRSVTPDRSSDSSFEGETSSDGGSSIPSLLDFICDECDEESSGGTEDEDFEHDVKIVQEINSMKVCTTRPVFVVTSYA
jgi:hypothetical protein